MFYQIFISAKVKRILTIIINKHGIYELPRELPNFLRLRILGNKEVSRKYQNCIELQPGAQSSSQNENFINASKNLGENRNGTFPVVRYFTCIQFVPNILSMIVGKYFFSCVCKLFVKCFVDTYIVEGQRVMKYIYIYIYLTHIQ